MLENVVVTTGVSDNSRLGRAALCAACYVGRGDTHVGVKGSVRPAEGVTHDDDEGLTSPLHTRRLVLLSPLVHC